MLTLTPHAVTKVKELYQADDTLTGKSLRVYVEKGGCSSYQYGFTFDDQKKDGDTALHLEGLNLLIDSESAALLSGSVIDYKEDIAGGGFAISNPHAKKSCGCGKSFDA